MITSIRLREYAGFVRHQRRRRTTPPTIFSGTVFRLRPRVEWMEDRTLLSTFLVTDIGDSGSGSLRQAILQSNAATGTTNTIDFDISGQGVQTITPLSSFPAITNPVLIDGESQPGYSGLPLIELNGGQAGGDGLLITTSDVTVRGLDIDSFAGGAGIHITGAGATGDWVYGNFLGTDPTGTQAEPNNYGIEIDAGATQNLIGTNSDGVNDAAERNVISGNSTNGVEIQSSDNNVVAGNLIGTDVSGAVAFVQQSVQLDVEIDSSSGNTIGGTVAGARNVISGSFSWSVKLNGSSDNLIAGDFIGTDVTGTKSLAVDNRGDANLAGIILTNASNGNTIGGTVADAADVISGNTGSGINIAGSSDNLVEGDLIGTDATGTKSLGNGDGQSGPYNEGVILTDASTGNTIGGTAAGAADVISGNKGWGVELDGSSDNLVEGDFIGTDATGTIALGNAQGGVDVTADLVLVPIPGIDGSMVLTPGIDSLIPSIDNTIGGTSATAWNLITDNGGPGVAVTVYSSVGNEIAANRIFGNTGQAIDLGDDGVTDNGTVLRGGPNDLQNFPILFTTADGQTEGWLGFSEPDTTYRIDVYASAGYGPGGAGEAQDYLGSLQETTDADGAVTFAIPFTAPAELPILTVTATDPQGNTSEVSALRPGKLEVPSQAIRLAPGQPLSFSAASGNGITLQDPEAGPLDLPWDLTLSVAAGTLNLSTTAGLSGTGDGTGSLAYSGPLSAIDAALAGMSYTAPPGYQGDPTLDLDAQSAGAAPIQVQVPIVVTSGRFEVTTTADSGPGSLRQAILDSNLAVGGTNTIDFDIPGTGVQTIAPALPLPTITTPVVIDGTTQPAYAGAPLIAIAGQGAGDADPLTAGSDLTAKGVAIGGSGFASVNPTTMLTVESVPISPSQGGMASYQIIVAADEDLVATAQAVGTTTSLSLLDALGRTVVQSDGLSAAEPLDAIDIDIAAGTYWLRVHDDGGAGTFTLTAMMTPSTTAFQAVPVGNDPDAVVAGDFTGNGTLDVAVANANDNTVSILLGNGDGTFQSAVNYPAGNDPVAMVAGDFNGDGKLDLAVVNGGAYGTVSILLGNGDGTFQSPASYTVGDSPAAIAVGDFRGDGHLDLAVANSASDNVSVLIGNGDGTFQPAVYYPVGYDPTEIVAGDFTGDGRLDLAVTVKVGLFTGDLSVLLNNGGGTFRPAGEYPIGGDTLAIVAGDFSANGRLDVALADQSGFLYVLLGNGDGTFQPAVDYSIGGYNPYAMVEGDFTGNGKLDLAVAIQSDNTVLMLLGNGDGTFQPAVDYPVGINPDGMAMGDFNGDGKLDVAVANSYDNTVSILIGNGDGTFRPAVERPVGNNYPGENGPDEIVAGDFNGDGRLDLAVANYNTGTVSILIGNGDGTFRAPVDYSLGAYTNPEAIAVGDFNGDGRLDLAVADEGSGTVSILLGNGDGTFQPAVSYSTGGPYYTINPGVYYTQPDAIVVGDFNGDGKLDLAFADLGSQEDVVSPDGSYQYINVQGGISVLLGNGDGTFQPAIYDPVEPADLLVAGDFTGDGKLDLVIGREAYDTFALLVGNGDGTFQPPVYEPAGSYPGAAKDRLLAITAGEFSGNGRLDLAALDSSGTVSILMGNGNGTFQPGADYFVNASVNAIVTGDFNGDGRLDLAVGYVGGPSSYYDGPDDVVILQGNGDGTFQPGINNEVESGFGSWPFGDFSDTELMTAGDFNGSGKLGVAFISIDSNIDVLLGQGDGTLSLAGQPTTNPQSNPLVVDVNGDGTNDVLIVDSAGDILYRQGIPGQPGIFESPITINSGNPSRDIAWMPNTDVGPVLASVDSDDDAISFYAYRDGGFVRLSGSLSTGLLPAQIIAAQLNSEGLTDLVVRDAGDGSLWVYFGAPSSDEKGTGPMGTLEPPTLLARVTLPVGLGVSNVQAIDTSGDGQLDLVVTDELTGQVSMLHNWGNDTFAAPVPYRTGTASSAVDLGDTPEVTSPDGTVSVAGGILTPHGPTGLVTINPGTDTIGVLDGLGGGRFANPFAIVTQSPGEIVRMGDFTGNGLDDLAVLTADGLSIYLANGQGGFLPPTTYPVPPEADGLSLADLTGNGKLDLLVGDAYGDVLVLLGNGNGTFSPYREANQAVELAVVDLTGKGAKDIIYADQGLDRVVVDYGAGSSDVLADQSSGLLEPGAVALADLNGDGIPDLIVANSGSNNVLIYPGLGNGQFGPAINDGNGYFVGTNPVGITVADLTGMTFPNGEPRMDLVIADKGSNQVSILFNTSKQGGAISFEAGPRLSSGGVGPVSTIVGHFSSDPNLDLLVTNSLSNNVVLLPGAGQGFFDDQDASIYSVGSDPGPTFVGNFNGQADLVTVNSGSNDLTLIPGFEGANPATSTIASGGVDPDAAFAFSSGSFEDLVVGNAGDGALALFEDGPDGLGLMSVETEPNVPDPTALAFSALTGGQVQFYAATAGRESAELVALSLGIEVATVAGPVSPSQSSPSVQLVALNDTSLPLVATVLTLTINVSGEELEFGPAESEAFAVGAFLAVTGTSVGQPVLSSRGGSASGADESALSGDTGVGVADTVPSILAPWERFVLGLDVALEEFRRQNATGGSGTGGAAASGDREGSSPSSSLPAQGAPTGAWLAPDPHSTEVERDGEAVPSPAVQPEAIDAAIETQWSDDARLSGPVPTAFIPPLRSVVQGRFRALGPEDPASAGRPHQDNAPEPPLRKGGTNGRNGVAAPAPAVPEPGTTRSGLVMSSWIVAAFAAKWVHFHRWPRPSRPGGSGRVGNPGRRRRVVIE
jgi:hypothetical protein